MLSILSLRNASASHMGSASGGPPTRSWRAHGNWNRVYAQGESTNDFLELQEIAKEKKWLRCVRENSLCGFPK